MAKRILLALVLSALLTGCGSLNVVDPESVHAGFPAAQSLTCTGTPVNQSCDESDGEHFYRHDQWTVSIGPDGHGTFQAITETGISHKTGLYQLTFALPETINIAEVHGALSISSWCDDNGIVTTWDSGNPGDPLKNIVGGKTYKFSAGQTADFPIEQIVFPVPIRSHGFTQNIYADLCSSSTVHWVFNGSF